MQHQKKVLRNKEDFQAWIFNHLPFEVESPELPKSYPCIVCWEIVPGQHGDEMASLPKAKEMIEISLKAQEPDPQILDACVQVMKESASKGLSSCVFYGAMTTLQKQNLWRALTQAGYTSWNASNGLGIHWRETEEG